jgi:hypothetical protein
MNGALMLAIASALACAGLSLITLTGVAALLGGACTIAIAGLRAWPFPSLRQLDQLAEIRPDEAPAGKAGGGFELFDRPDGLRSASVWAI